MRSFAAVLSGLVALPLIFAAPAPLESRQAGGGTRTLFVAANADFLNGQQISASGGAFYVGVPTNAICPSGTSCGTYSNQTAIMIDSLSSTAGMYSSQPSKVYVARNGVLSFTEPEKIYSVPDGAYQNPFDGQGGVLHFGGGNFAGWIACPVSGTPGQLPYQIQGRVKSMDAVCAGAVDIAITTQEATSAGAYEYE